MTVEQMKDSLSGPAYQRWRLFYEVLSEEAQEAEGN